MSSSVLLQLAPDVVFDVQASVENLLVKSVLLPPGIKPFRAAAVECLINCNQVFFNIVAGVVASPNSSTLRNQGQIQEA